MMLRKMGTTLPDATTYSLTLFSGDIPAYSDIPAYATNPIFAEAAETVSEADPAFTHTFTSTSY